jgi:hypothetical protein
MVDEPRSNRPTPRTAAAVEAELRRRIRAELTQARSDADGELDDAALAGVIARAIGAALGWHLESPEHARNATLSSRTWRPAGGPRGGQRGREFEDREPREFDDRGPRQFEDRGPRPPFDDRRPPFRDRPPFQERRPREDDRDESGPRWRPGPGPRSGGGGRPSGGRPSGGRPSGGGRPGGSGGFGPRRPPPRGR